MKFFQNFQSHFRGTLASPAAPSYTRWFCSPWAFDWAPLGLNSINRQRNMNIWKLLKITYLGWKKMSKCFSPGKIWQKIPTPFESFWRLRFEKITFNILVKKHHFERIPKWFLSRKKILAASSYTSALVPPRKIDWGHPELRGANRQTFMTLWNFKIFRKIFGTFSSVYLENDPRNRQNGDGFQISKYYKDSNETTFSPLRSIKVSNL